MAIQRRGRGLIDPDGVGLDELNDRRPGGGFGTQVFQRSPNVYGEEVVPVPEDALEIDLRGNQPQPDATLPAVPLPGQSGPTANRQGPTERGPVGMPTSLSGGFSGQAPAAQVAPTRPNEPTPMAAAGPAISSQPPPAFEPMPMAAAGPAISSQPPPAFEPMPSGMSPSQTTVPGVVRRGISQGGPNAQGGRLLGKAGGLLGGGLGVPGIMGSTGGDDISALIAQLFRMANR